MNFNLFKRKPKTKHKLMTVTFLTDFWDIYKIKIGDSTYEIGKTDLQNILRKFLENEGFKENV